MSTINKKPFIKDLLGSLTAEETSTLINLIDGGGNQTPILRTMSIKPSGNRTNITAADKGVRLCNLELNYSLFNGYLIYNDDYCVLIAFTDSQKLMMFNINGLNLENIDEELSVLELRSELVDFDVTSLLDFATAEDVYIALAIVDVGDREIEENTLVLDEDDYIEENTVFMA